MNRICDEKDSFSDRLGEAQQELESSLSKQKASQLELESLKTKCDKVQMDLEENIRSKETDNDTHEEKRSALATQNEDLQKLMSTLQGDLDNTQAQLALEKQKVSDAFIEIGKIKHLQLVSTESPQHLSL